MEGDWENCVVYHTEADQSDWPQGNTSHASPQGLAEFLPN